MRLFVALFSVLFATPAAAQAPAPGTYAVHVIDVGTGLAVFVEGADFALIYDAGSIDDVARGNQNRVLAYLRAVRPDLRRIDHLILSHPHRDHTELMPDVLAAYEVSNVWDSGSFNPVCSYRLFLDGAAREAAATYHHGTGRPGPHSASFPAALCYGQQLPAETISLPHSVAIGTGSIRLGAGATMHVLNARAAALGGFHDGNLVVRLDLGARRILLPGDAEGGKRRPPSEPPEPGSTEARLIECCAGEIRADILVAPQHGSKTSSRAAFLNAVGATQFVVSAGPTRYAGVTNPAVEVLLEYERRGVVWRTDSSDFNCSQNPAKIGPDNDGRPGGCDNVRISIDRAGAVNAAYMRAAD